MATHSNPPRILITGASRGIGRATAQQLAHPGARLVLLSRTQQSLEELAAELRERGTEVQVLVADLTRPDSVQRSIDLALAAGPLDVVINNAGICHQGRFLDMAADRLQEEWELNVFGPQRVTAAVLPSMLQRRRGRIWNVSSLLGSVAAPTTANYSATKAALEAFSQGLHGEVREYGVSVRVFVAPHTQTEQGKRVHFDGVKSLPVDYVAGRLATAALHGTDRAYGSPVYAAIDTIARWFPRLIARQIARSAATVLARSG